MGPYPKRVGTALPADAAVAGAVDALVRQDARRAVRLLRLALVRGVAVIEGDAVRVLPVAGDRAGVAAAQERRALLDDGRGAGAEPVARAARLRARRAGLVAGVAHVVL